MLVGKMFAKILTRIHEKKKERKKHLRELKCSEKIFENKINARLEVLLLKMIIEK